MLWKIMQYKEKLKGIPYIHFIGNNWFRYQIKRENNAYLCAYKNTIFQLDQTAQICLKGKLHLNKYRLEGSKRETLLRMDKNSKLIVNGNYTVFYGGDIIIFEGGILELGSGYSNVNLKIRCRNHIIIGNNVVIAHDVTIMDSDYHRILCDSYEMSKPVQIGDNVWIGTKATILKGVTIGEGAIVGAGATVTKNVPPHCIVAGNPAKIVKENITWEG